MRVSFFTLGAIVSILGSSLCFNKRKVPSRKNNQARDLANYESIGPKIRTRSLHTDIETEVEPGEILPKVPLSPKKNRDERPKFAENTSDNFYQLEMNSTFETDIPSSSKNLIDEESRTAPVDKNMSPKNTFEDRDDRSLSNSREDHQDSPVLASLSNSQTEKSEKFASVSDYDENEEIKVAVSLNEKIDESNDYLSSVKAVLFSSESENIISIALDDSDILSSFDSSESVDQNDNFTPQNNEVKMKEIFEFGKKILDSINRIGRRCSIGFGNLQSSAKNLTKNFSLYTRSFEEDSFKDSK